MLPVGEDIGKAEPEVVQPWFADDVAMAGPTKRVAAAMTLLQRLGPVS